MIMATIIQDGTQFTNISTSLFDSNNYAIATSYTIDPDTDEITHNEEVINAIDIDWNNGELSDGTVINTTAELIKYIYKMKVQLQSLT